VFPAVGVPVYVWKSPFTAWSGPKHWFCAETLPAEANNNIASKILFFILIKFLIYLLVGVNDQSKPNQVK
jgi:hypothetical protein